MSVRRPSCALAAASLFAALGAFAPAGAQTAQDVAAAASQTCAVMAGQQKLDGRTLQYLQMLDGDLADGNPIELLLQRDVLHECPKTYLAYQQRVRHSNPFAAHPLVGAPVQLLGGGRGSGAAAPMAKDYPVRCLGKPGMASASGTGVTVTFSAGMLASLAPGQCAWLDRAFRPNEHRKLFVKFTDAATATKVRAAFDAGKLWTIWLRNDGSGFTTTFIALGAKTTKVH